MISIFLAFARNAARCVRRDRSMVHARSGAGMAGAASARVGMSSPTRPPVEDFDTELGPGPPRASGRPGPPLLKARVEIGISQPGLGER